jgi:hypothetical protein
MYRTTADEALSSIENSITRAGRTSLGFFHAVEGRIPTASPRASSTTPHESINAMTAFGFLIDCSTSSIHFQDR